MRVFPAVAAPLADFLRANFDQLTSTHDMSVHQMRRIIKRVEGGRLPETMLLNTTDMLYESVHMLQLAADSERAGLAPPEPRYYELDSLLQACTRFMDELDMLYGV